MIDLFGQEIAPPVMPVKGKRKPTKPNGYVMPPGSGPEGETCKTCKHLARLRWSKIYLKCGLAEAIWTRGPGSDVRARSPACSKWESPSPTTQEASA